MSTPTQIGEALPARIPVVTRPPRDPERIAAGYEHILPPGGIIDVDALKPLGYEMREGKGHFAWVARITLGQPWQEYTEGDRAYMASMKEEWRDTDEDQMPQYPAYNLLWLDIDGAERDDDGNYLGLPHPDVVSEDPAVVIGDEFLAKDEHGRLIADRGLLGLQNRGKWIYFGPEVERRKSPEEPGMDYPDGADDFLFAILVDVHAPHQMRLANISQHDMALMCYAQEITPPSAEQ